MTCPILRCVNAVAGPLRLCSTCYRLVPVPQRDALGHYARTRKHGPAHKAAFARAVETVTQGITGRQAKTWPVPAATLPYKDAE